MMKASFIIFWSIKLLVKSANMINVREVLGIPTVTQWENLRLLENKGVISMTKHDRMMNQIEQHGENIKAIFNLDVSIDPVKLCKQLRRLELKANRAATCLCNTNTLYKLELTRQQEIAGIRQATYEEQDTYFEAILAKVDKILGFKKQGIPVFVNRDPRGYALKIKDDWMWENYNKLPDAYYLYIDFGGYGIIAPEFTGE